MMTWRPQLTDYGCGPAYLLILTTLSADLYPFRIRLRSALAPLALRSPCLAPPLSLCFPPCVLSPLSPLLCSVLLHPQPDWNTVYTFPTVVHQLP